MSFFYKASLLLHLSLYRLGEGKGVITCSFPKRCSKMPQTIVISSFEKKNKIRDICAIASTISLEGESTLTVDGIDKIPLFVDWLFFGAKLEMCVSVENTESLEEMIIVTKSIVGNCEGPRLKIVNNTNLKTVLFRRDQLAKSLSSVRNALRVRGNRKLASGDLKVLKQVSSSLNGDWDLQPVGECVLPKPFTSFEVLDQNCTDFYGALTLQEGLTNFHYDLSKVHKFNLEGCIQIEKTGLKDISFLSAFSRFHRMQSCSQFIRDNKKLCPRNLQYLNVIFKDIQFSNNSNDLCGECIGGQVSEHYLRVSINCSIVYGDLIVANLRGLPSNFENLRSIEAIEGRLIIVNNTGLNKFDYLASLKKVGRSNGNDVAMTVRDNGDLSSLELPNLVHTQLQRQEKMFELANNPILTGIVKQTTTLYTEVKEVYTIGFEENTLENGESLGKESSAYTDRISHSTIFGITTALVSLVMLSGIAIFLIYQRRTPAKRLSKFQTKPKIKISSLNASINQSFVQNSSVSSSTSASNISTSNSSNSDQAAKSHVNQSQHKVNCSTSTHN